MRRPPAESISDNSKRSSIITVGTNNDSHIYKLCKEDLFMKKKLAVLLSILMALSCFMLAACGNSASQEAAEDAAEDQAEAAAEEQTAPVNGDQESRESLRQQIMIDYIKANGLNVTKYQDEGWDPVELAL